MKRVINFSAGPAAIPVEVLKRAQEDFVNYQESGLSVMEMSHRSSEFMQIRDEAEVLLRELMEIPDTYDVLFLQGGASLQFAMIPMNLCKKGDKVAYFDTGMWSNKAIDEAQKFVEVSVLASSKDKTYSYLPVFPEVSADYTYLHVTSNNTIYGTAIRPSRLEEIAHHTLIADMSSNILSEPYDVSKFGVIYAGAQKNLGPAGVTIVIIRKDLVTKNEALPTMLRYDIHAKNDSLYNTPPTFSIYMMKLVLEWVKSMGGVLAMQQRNVQKADQFYAALDQSKLFSATVTGSDRSIMNIPFVTGNAAMDKVFIQFAQENGLINLTGHRSVGGMRASIYNALSLADVQVLIDVMKTFEKKVESGEINV